MTKFRFQKESEIKMAHSRKGIIALIIAILVLILSIGWLFTEVKAAQKQKDTQISGEILDTAHDEQLQALMNAGDEGYIAVDDDTKAQINIEIKGEVEHGKSIDLGNEISIESEMHGGYVTAMKTVTDTTFGGHSYVYILARIPDSTYERFYEYIGTRIEGQKDIEKSPVLNTAEDGSKYHLIGIIVQEQSSQMQLIKEKIIGKFLK